MDVELDNTEIQTVKVIPLNEVGWGGDCIKKPSNQPHNPADISLWYSFQQLKKLGVTEKKSNLR